MCALTSSHSFVLYVIAFYWARNVELSDIKRCEGIRDIGKEYLIKLKHCGIRFKVYSIYYFTAMMLHNNK